MRHLLGLTFLALAGASSAGCTLLPLEEEAPVDVAPLELHPWAQKIKGQVAPTTVASGPEGDIYLGGTFQGTVSFGGGWLEGEAPGTLFVAHLDPDGEHEMSGATGANDTLQSMAVGADGTFYAVGNFDGDVNFGTGQISGGNDGYLAAFGDDGRTVYARGIHGDAYVYVDGVVATADGGVVIAARADDTTDFGAGTIAATQGQAQMVVAHYDRNGTHLWEQRINGYAIDRLSLTTDGEGNVFFGGSTYQQATIAGTSVGYSTFVVKLDAQGAVGWVRPSSSDNGYLPMLVGLSAAEDGSVCLAGYYYYEPFEIGGIKVPPSQTRNTFLVKLSPEGDGIYAKGFPSDNYLEGLRIATAKGGDLLVAMGSYYPVDFGGGPVGHVTDNDLLLARFDAKGNHLKSMALDGNEDEWVVALTADPTGKAVIVGMFNNLLDIGEDRLVASGGSNAFVARLDF